MPRKTIMALCLALACGSTATVAWAEDPKPSEAPPPPAPLPEGIVRVLDEVSGQHFSAVIPQLAPEAQPQSAIVTFGAALGENGEIPPVLEERLVKTQQAAELNPAAPIVVTGGKPKKELTEAQAMKNWLVDRGVAPERILLEDRSVSTVSNAKNLKVVLNDQLPNVQELMLITSPNHLRRATVDTRVATESRYRMISIPAGAADVVPPVPAGERTGMEKDLRSM